MKKNINTDNKVGGKIMDYKFKISVVMAVYNVEDYIDEAIDSIIKQDIGFEENVQIVLVNDGSPDNSLDHCKRYAEEYPNNIICIDKKNGGVSSARNEGLKKVDAKYVTFTDPDDILPPNTFSEVYNFFEKNYICINQVCIPLVFFEAQTGLHQKYRFLEEDPTNRVIDLMEEPYNFILSSASMFYKYDAIKDLKFDETLSVGEDIKFNCELYKINPKYGYVHEHGVQYNYRQRNTANSAVNNAKKSTVAYKGILKVFEKFDLDNLMDFEKEIIIYELRSRIKNIRKGLFNEKKDYEDILNEYKKYIERIDDHFIIYYSKWAEVNVIKETFLRLKGSNLKKYIEKEKYTKGFCVRLKDYYVKDDKFIVEIVFDNYGADVDAVMVDGNNDVYEAVEREDFDGPYNAKYGEIAVDDTHYRKYELDLSNKVIRFFMHNKSDNNYFIPASVRVDLNTKLSIRGQSVHITYKNKNISFNGRKFKIYNNKSIRFLYLLKTTLFIFIKHRYFPLMRLFTHKNKKYILVNDRPEKAGDNGEALFKYINKNEPEMAKNTYFIIDSKNEDYKRMKQYGKVVRKNSLKHKYLFMNAKMIYSSHNARLFFYPFPVDKFRYYSDLLDYKYIWIQHGVIYNDVSVDANRLNTKNDAIITSSFNEYKEISKKSYFFNQGQILLTGLARFDYLENDEKNIISLCPTWRKDLTGQILADGTHETLPNFEKTDYYENISKLLSNKKLYELLKQHNYILQLVLHPGVSGYKEYFDLLANDCIKIVSQDEVSYTRVFKESKLLITDYSSLFFDFAYLKKPEIYFQFDKEYFFSSHYAKGYFEYERDAFGDVLETADKVVEKIEYYFNNDFKMENKYLERVDKTFKYIDKNNSKRIIEVTYKK